MFNDEDVPHARTDFAPKEDMTVWHDCRPPLCMAVQAQQPLDLISVLMLPTKKYRIPLGVDEQDRSKSAMCYAMQSGRHDVVKAVSVCS